MASLVQAFIDQENITGAGVRLKNAGSRQLNGTSGKSFQSNRKHLATPRRALGDLGNQLPTKPTEKGFSVKKPLTTQNFATKHQALQKKVAGFETRLSNSDKTKVQVGVDKGVSHRDDDEPIEKMHIYEEEDDFEDILPRCERLSTLLFNPSEWRPRETLDDDGDEQADSHTADLSLPPELMELPCTCTYPEFELENDFTTDNLAMVPELPMSLLSIDDIPPLEF